MRTRGYLAGDGAALGGWRVALVALVMLLGGCAHPLTAPPGPSCATYMHPYLPANPTDFRRPVVEERHPSPLEQVLDKKVQGEAGASPSRLAELAPVKLNVLVLSGGGEYGAYGAGFLTGMYGSPPGTSAARPQDFIPLEDYDVVTGISTGAMMTTYVWGAIIYDRQHPGSAGANDGLLALAGLYKLTDKDLFSTQNALLAILTSNGLYDPRGLLERQVSERVRAYAPFLRTGGDVQADVGAVNVRNGVFYSFDLKAMVDANDPAALNCYSEAVLASAAIPLAFPPRFIDQEPYYDGGVRFLAYYQDVLRNLQSRATGRRIELNIRVIVNGSQSVNDAGKDAAQANACDQARAPGTHPQCPPIANSLLGALTGPGAKGLILRTTEDIMVQQIKADAVYRLWSDWKATAGPGTFKYTYIPNSELASPPPGAQVSGACQTPQNSSDQFDVHFMNCLFEIGKFKGAAARWTFEDTK
jgi:hypothetical protein